MFRCNSCNRQFEYSDTGRTLLGRYYKVTEECPFCHCEDMTESIAMDVYGDYVYPGDTYYDFGTELVAEDNLQMFLDDCRRGV